MPQDPSSTRRKTKPRTNGLRAEPAEARKQLAEAQEVIRAIQPGEVDAVVVDGPTGSQRYTLRNVDYPYRSLIEAMNEGAANLSADGHILYCNRTLSRLTGLPLEKIIGQPASRLCAGGFGPMLGDMIERIRRGEPATAETELAASNGRRQIPVHLSLSPILSDESGGICMVVTDLTERMEREKRIADERKRLFDILEALPVMTCLLATDRKVKFANRMFREKFGEANDRPCYEFCFGNSFPCEFCESFTPLDTGKPHQWEVESVDGRIIEAHDLPFTDIDGSRTVLQLNFDVTEQRRTQAELQSQREQLRLLAARLEQAREDERTRVARDLHDDIGQILTAIKMDLTHIEKRLSRVPDEVSERLKSAMNLTDNSLIAVRKVCSALRPAILDDLGLEPAIEWQTSEFSSKTGIRCEVSLPRRKMRLNPATATAIFRIYQECLTNVMRHAQAQIVRVSLYERSGNAYFCVEDDGKGFREAEVSGSLGLLGMKERAHGCGGELQIESSPGKGTTITLKVPKNKGAETENTGTEETQARKQ
jgi:PAS domain S-box-containing protein